MYNDCLTFQSLVNLFRPTRLITNFVHCFRDVLWIALEHSVSVLELSATPQFQPSSFVHCQYRTSFVPWEPTMVSS